MNSELSRKIIVASGMALVVGIIAVTVALRSHHPVSVAQIAQPPAALAQVPDAPAPVAPTPDVPAAVAPIPDASNAIADNDNVDAKFADSASSVAVEPKVIGNRHQAKARMSADTTDHTVAPESTVDSSEKSADETLAKSVAGETNGVDLPIPSTVSNTATDAQEGATGKEPAGSDSRITTEVKSQFAADGIGKDVDIGVTTTQGVVVLTGTLVTQDAIDRVRNVAEQVKDVKSVDTSAMKVTST
jgi:hyperosmotically inducible protein